MNIIKPLTVFLLLIVPLTITAQVIKSKSDLKILIVAHNPDSTLNLGEGMPIDPRYAELAKTRGQEFKNLLDPFFQTVKVINSETYHYTMSNAYDVTIIDDLPKPIERIDLGQYRYGKSIIRDGKPMSYDRFLPENFDRAIIMTGPLTDDMTYGTTSKFVTQCHCLSSHAFNIKEEHEIFNSPYQVDLSYEKRKTPGPLKKYYSGIDFPDEMNMWRVQTESPEDGNGYLIGQILVGMGFDDSPDAEFISGGESIKDITGMSLGRSGSMFHWGFSASPNFMTETAKTVFINTVFYMSKFNKKKPLVKKATANSRYWIDEFCFKKTGKLIDHQYKTYPQSDTLVKFYTENYDYFINTKGLTFEVDYDAKSLGIPNSNLELLIKSVALLEVTDEKEKALRLLKRYTEYEFDNAKDWKLWLNKYNKYLFFTELGGYKFMIDTWNHPELEESIASFVKKRDGPSMAVVNKEEDELKAKIELKRIRKNNYMLQVSVTIDEGWHAYAKLTSETNYFIPTNIEIIIPTGSHLVGEMAMPNTFPYENLKGVEVYKGVSVFKQKITVDKSFSKNDGFKVLINYQLCNDYLCKVPATKELIISL